MKRRILLLTALWSVPALLTVLEMQATAIADGQPLHSWPELVPSFTLQALVENAIRHGISATLDAGVLDIATAGAPDSLEITVADDGPGPARESENDGIGLSSLRTRLRELHGPTAAVTLSRRPAGGCIARVTMPLVTAGE